MNKPAYKILNAIFIAIIAIFLFGCGLMPSGHTGDETSTGVTAPTGSESSTVEETGSLSDETGTPEPSVDDRPKGSTSVRIRAVGDIMMHSPQIPAGQKQDGSYDFRYFFDEVKPYLEDADITMGNFECTIGDGSKGYTGYPLFRSPKEVIAALKYAGFNVLTTANNHSFDGGEFGVEYTLDQLDAYGIMHTGTARSPEERNKVLLVEKNDIKIAILAYTYGTNGMESIISGEKLEYMVNYIDKDKIVQDIERAREAGADAIVAAMHWGNEYQRTPHSSQKELADFLFSAGVDVIFGSHPHVIQPMEKREITLDDGTSRDVFVIYSMSNFLSNQYWQYSDSGVIVEVEITKNHDTGKVSVGNVGYIPTWVQRVFLPSGKREYRVLPVAKFRNDNSLDSNHRSRINEVWNETTEHISDGTFPVIQ